MKILTTEFNCLKQWRGKDAVCVKYRREYCWYFISFSYSLFFPKTLRSSLTHWNIWCGKYLLYNTMCWKVLVILETFKNSEPNFLSREISHIKQKQWDYNNSKNIVTKYIIERSKSKLFGCWSKTNKNCKKKPLWSNSWNKFYNWSNSQRDSFSPVFYNFQIHTDIDTMKINISIIFLKYWKLCSKFFNHSVQGNF